ncbi:MAG: lysophospholipase [Hyphomonas sp.]|uniref:alpha/beta fold hydrolase n=1 Tax=Hyphomonas sp. TaxID=87 RepID=UPI0017DD77E7|nr:alpha/beta fold hydrolase [Hyphomonas sp.]MBU3921817.1 lysophospholipase [Alphaproteobacteria bacterium]MBA3067474.1 lysophospholipase [Hyphomonas sp.]MBU4063362.1 lysophospholipase [Alphaproteobacteria bacterium]MBU4165182.1 lysophospholipase [Alphaproteobacteria bacterium]MBU4569653.1 lysophospholipase [Alphaproteobacteria bacterium]
MKTISKQSWVVRLRAGIAALVSGLAVMAMPACAHPVTIGALKTAESVAPSFLPEQNTFIAADGARLGLTVWPAEGTAEPDYVVVAVHGMSDYANAFHMAAPYWAKHGVTSYAYDQRGFGRSPNKGYWPEEELMRADLRTAVDVARKRHPGAVITVVGVSMGASVALTAFGSDDPPKADRLILSGPGLRGWGAINPLYRASLYASAHMNPGWIVVPPAGLIKIEPSDNLAMLRRTWSDPNMTYENRIDAVFGLVTLMEHAHQSAAALPRNLPILASYGARDIVVPENGVERTAKLLPPNVRTVYYPNGYHMLLRDLQAEKVHADYLAFIKDPEAPLPSGEGEWPFRHPCLQMASLPAASAAC